MTATFSHRSCLKPLFNWTKNCFVFRKHVTAEPPANSVTGHLTKDTAANAEDQWSLCFSHNRRSVEICPNYFVRKNYYYRSLSLSLYFNIENVCFSQVLISKLHYGINCGSVRIVRVIFWHIFNNLKVSFSIIPKKYFDLLYQKLIIIEKKNWYGNFYNQLRPDSEHCPFFKKNCC